MEPKCRRTAFQAPFNSRGPLYRITRTPTWRRRRLHRRQITRDSTEAGTERAWDMGRRRGQRATRPARVWALWLVSNGGGSGALIDCAPWLRGGLEGPLDRSAGRQTRNSLGSLFLAQHATEAPCVLASFPFVLSSSCVLACSVSRSPMLCGHCTPHAACCSRRFRGSFNQRMDRLGHGVAVPGLALGCFTLRPPTHRGSVSDPTWVP